MKWKLSLLFCLLFPLSVSADITSFVASGLSGSSPTINLGTTNYLTFKSASNTNLQMEFGDGGTTATQLLYISPGTLVSDNDAGILLCGGGKNGGSTCSAGWGGLIEIYGEDHANKGDVYINTGDASGSDLTFWLNAANSVFSIRNPSNQVMWSFDTATASLTQNATNGGPLLLAAAKTAAKGIVAGLGALPADVTSALGGAEIFTFNDALATVKSEAHLHGQANANGPLTAYLKSRSTDGSADTIVQNGDVLLDVKAFGSNGATFDNAAELTVEVDGTPGASNDMPGRFVFYVAPDGSASTTEAMRISSTQKVTFAGNDLGWTIVDQTDNQACTTGCTSACVAGQDLAGANKPLVTCADTTADICLCAGAS